LVIKNAEEGTQSFKVRPEELSIIKDYLDSKETRPSIMLASFGRRAIIRFANESIRQKSILAYCGSKENGGVVDNCA
jgi:hypothetical protein